MILRGGGGGVVLETSLPVSKFHASLYCEKLRKGLPSIKSPGIEYKLSMILHSGTPLNGHPSTADTCDIMDNSDCPGCISIL